MGQDFGRFGYRSEWRLPALSMTREGIRAHHPEANQLRFDPVPPHWSPVATSETGQTVVLAAMGNSPVKKARADLFGLGCSLYVEGRLRLRATSTSSPFLTWTEGSVGSGVPTPAADWVALSFRDQQPPLAFGFESGPAALRIEGSSGDWAIETVEPYIGWVRVSAPNGIRPLRTNGAAELGELSALCRKLGSALFEPVPKLLSSDVEPDGLGLELRLAFDRPGAIVPPAWMLAPLAGYYVKLATDSELLPIQTEDGPIYVATEPAMNVRFPARRVPIGRALGYGPARLPEFGTVSSLHVPGVVELSLALLSGGADAPLRAIGTETLEGFFDQATYATEPFTKQSLPFSPSGDESDVVAAQSLLMQALQNGQTVPQTNSLLTSLGWRRDWFTCSLLLEDETRRRRAMALAALSGALSPDPLRRLDGAYFQAGLAGLEGLEIWRRRRGLPAGPLAKSDPMRALRARIFGMRAVGPEPYFEYLLSPIRVLGPRGFALEDRDGLWYLVGLASDTGPISFSLLAPYSLAAEAGENVTELSAEDLFGNLQTTVRPKAAGPFTLRLIRPDWAPPLPASVPPPAYSE